MARKGFWVALVPFIVFGLVACGSVEDTHPSAVSTPAPTVASPEPTPTNWTPSETAEETPSPEPSPTEQAPVAEQPVATPDTELLQLLAKLPVEEESNTRYDRNLFSHWSRQGDGCTTRQHVLAEEAINGTTRNCNTTGSWVSVYDGKTTTDPSTFDIDHFVPLQEAWRSGADEWDSRTREAFANDITYPYSLIAVSASSNRSKGSKDPSAWMPPTMNQCDYITQWMLVKYRWSLNIDPREKTALQNIGVNCDNTVTLPPVASITVGSKPADTPAPTPTSQPSGGTDPRFGTCREAKAAGYGPYVRGVDTEYDWYRDGDQDGTVCE